MIALSYTDMRLMLATGCRIRKTNSQDLQRWADHRFERQYFQLSNDNCKNETEHTCHISAKLSANILLKNARGI